jgi:uncharacterized LabA/DUF88 family protein
MGIRSDLQTELKNLLASDIIKGKVSVQRAYADWRRYPQYIVPLAESSIDMIMAPAYGSAKKNATDIRLAIDALELVFVRPEIGTFILLSGDSDFSSLVIKLKEYGKYVIGVGIRESSSDLLVMNCDEYYSYNALAGLVKSGEEEVVKHDPWELVTEAVQRMKRNGDVMRADRLKQVMQQIDSSFDEKDVGKAKFSLFVSEAAKRGLLSLNKLENGQLEVDLPRAQTAPAGDVQAPAPEPAAAQQTEEVDEDRARRSRRGRGRGRDREERPAREPRGDGAGPVAAVHPASLARPDARPAQPAPTPTARTQRAAAGDIGASGLRLTREEAFDLVRRAVTAAAQPGKSAPASRVRAEARSLLGRDSESLSERNFIRILHDAHDADIVDLRKRGRDYEVAAAAQAPTVELQLEKAAAANAPAPKPVAPVTRGMGARGGGGRGMLGARGAPPANLLNVGVVGSSSAKSVTPAPSAAPTNTTKPAEDAESVGVVDTGVARATSADKPARGRKRAAAKKTPGAKVKQPSASKSAASVSDTGTAQPEAAAKRKRTARKKTAAKAAAGADSK